MTISSLKFPSVTPFALAIAAAARARPVVFPSFWPLLEDEAFGAWLLQLEPE